MSGYWEKRWHPLRREWVIISANTGARPWGGARVGGETATTVTHDPGCYLCPGNTRAGGVTNPEYSGPYAFDNDFPSLSFAAPGSDGPNRGQAGGLCRVLCWSSQHNDSLATLSDAALADVVRLMRDEHARARLPGVAQVLVFENRGAEIGVSNSHPHGQLYATDFVTRQGREWRDAQSDHHAATGGRLIPDYLASLDPSQCIGRRGEWAAWVPDCARLPYETWVTLDSPVAHLDALSDAQCDSLGPLLGQLVRAFDAHFGRATPMNLLWASAPVDDDARNAHWQLTLMAQPALREPDKLKYFGGFEQLSGNVVNPLRPEDAAEHLSAAMAATAR